MPSAEPRDTLTTLNQVPWMPIITLIGWVVFGATFYVTTQRTLAEDKTAIERILTTREKMVDTYNTQFRQLNDTVIEQTRSNALRFQAEDSRIDNLEKNMNRLEQRIEQMLQALDAQYNALNDHLRSHGAAGVPRR